MTLIQKASDRLDARGITHQTDDVAILLGVWNVDLTEVYDLYLSIPDIMSLAEEYDEMTEDNQHQHQQSKTHITS